MCFVIVAFPGYFHLYICLSNNNLMFSFYILEREVRNVRNTLEIRYLIISESRIFHFISRVERNVMSYF